MEQTTTLVTVVWDIFEKQWKQRNEILHGTDSKLLEGRKTQKMIRYKEFVDKKYDMLRRCDHHFVEHNSQEVLKWPAQKMLRVLKNLEILHKQYMKEVKLEQEGYAPLTTYFRPVRAATPPCLGDPG